MIKFIYLIINFINFYFNKFKKNLKYNNLK